MALFSQFSSWENHFGFSFRAPEVPEPRILESGFLMKKSEKKDHSFLGSKRRIFEFIYSESLHPYQKIT